MDSLISLKLEIIVLLDSICYGLIYAFISPHLIIVGGDQLTVGVLSVVILFCQLLSADVVRIATKVYGKQDALLIVLIAGLISHLIIAFTASCWILIFARGFFSITNQVQWFCKDMLLKNIDKGETEYHLIIFNILSSSGFIIGPIVTGSLFSIGFYPTCYLAALLTLINIGLVLTISPLRDDNLQTSIDEPLVKRLLHEFAETVNCFNKSNYEKNWDLISMKFLFATSISVFFTKFTQIMKHNFSSDSVTIGYTSSYMNAVMFASTYLLNKAETTFNKYTMSALIYSAYLTLICSLLIACYSYAFLFYVIICLPIIFTRCYINTIWEKLFIQRENDCLTKINNNIGITAGLTMPIMFGIICNNIGHHAVILFSILPLVISVIILRKYTFPLICGSKDKGTGKRAVNLLKLLHLLYIILLFIV